MRQNGVVSALIDTTEMYLKTVFELEEEGVTPLRARIAERLQQSGPTVSQTVARMERDGLLTVEGDRHLEFTPEGRLAAARVMRKHRLVERLLTDVIGLDLEFVHEEACRWEHVVSEHVERRLVQLLVPVAERLGDPGHAELLQARDRVAVRRLGRGVEQLDQPALDVLGDHVLPATSLVVHLLPVQPNHVDKQPLGQPVLAHHPHRPGATLRGELEMPITQLVDQVVPLHPGDGLRHGRTTLMQPFGDPGPKRDDALLLELVDRPQVHLRGVDQVAHVLSSLTLVDHVRVATVLDRELAGLLTGQD